MKFDPTKLELLVNARFPRRDEEADVAREVRRAAVTTMRAIGVRRLRSSWSDSMQFQVPLHA